MLASADHRSLSGKRIRDCVQCFVFFIYNNVLIYMNTKVDSAVSFVLFFSVSVLSFLKS